MGKRLFPLIGVGGSLGAWLGSVRAGTLIEGSSPSRLLLGACVLLVVSAALVPLIDRVTARSQAAPRSGARAPLGGDGGFSLIGRDRYLALLAALMLLLNVVNTCGEYLLGRYVVEESYALFGADASGEAARERFIGETYSRFFSTVNLLGFLLQTFVVSRAFKWLGIGPALFIHPIVAVAGYLVMLRVPSLQAIASFKVADNSINYSLGNTTRQALWLPTSREAKYKAKQAIDSFVVRGGDVASAAIVFVGERLAFTVSTFAAINVVMALAWLLVAVLLTTAHGRRTIAPAAAAR
jgi:AAA family ATP:ADP antiporter